MADKELDAQFQPSGRPQSTIARSFSAHLDDAFSLSGGVEDLSVSIFSKQQNVHTQNRELEALEMKLREMEQRLEEQKRKRANGAHAAPSTSSQTHAAMANGSASSYNRRKVDDELFQQPSTQKPLGESRPESAGNSRQADGH